MRQPDNVAAILALIFWLGTLVTYIVLCREYPKKYKRDPTIAASTLPISKQPIWIKLAKIWGFIFVAIFSISLWLELFFWLFRL